MTCHWFRHHAGVNCIPVLTCQLHQELIAHVEQLVSRFQGWTYDRTRQQGSAPGVVLETHAPQRCYRQAAASLPTEVWISNAPQVLQFRPVRYERFSKMLELNKRGLEKDAGEWHLINATHNILRLFRYW
jgi:hypothetical protein